MTPVRPDAEPGSGHDLVLARRRAVVDAMARADLDVLVLGRQDDATYASGMDRLWTAGTRPFGAGCVIVRGDDPLGDIRVMSSWDAGIPPSIPFDHLMPLTWNPRHMAGALAAIDGLGSARRIGVDTWSTGFATLAAKLAPDAELVPADALMAEVRRHKRPEEIELIRAACRVCRLGVDAAVAAFGEGVTDPELVTVAAIRAMASEAGATIPSSGVRAVVEGAELLIDVGMMVDDYEGGAGGRFAAGRPVDDRTALADACVPGAAWGDLAAAATAADWCVRGLGMGFERPVLGPTLGRSESLEAD
ncbi:MAG: aminopeptidase P family N-terminal domain-containing protein, partial [Acidimicrobiales bacterium]